MCKRTPENLFQLRPKSLEESQKLSKQLEVIFVVEIKWFQISSERHTVNNKMQ